MVRLILEGDKKKLPYDDAILYCNMVGLILEGYSFLPYGNTILCCDIESCILGGNSFFFLHHIHIFSERMGFIS